MVPEMGVNAAIDSSDLPAYANGQRYLSKNGPERMRFSDPDASWGHRSAVSTRKGGGFYGYKIHAAVCTRTDLPLAWRVESANHGDALFALPLMDAIRGAGILPGDVRDGQGIRLTRDPRQLRGRWLSADHRADPPAEGSHSR